jgi:hypothetical protein
LGPGSRLAYHAGKAALRSGTVEGTQWNEAEVGPQSQAFGLNTVASGNGSFASGYGLGPQGEIIAEGEGTRALGWANNNSLIKASGRGSYARGFAESDALIFAGSDGASADCKAIFGGQIIATGEGSHVSGFVSSDAQMIADDHGAHTSGLSTGPGSLIISTGNGSHASGRAEKGGQIYAGSSGSHAMGYTRDNGSIIEARLSGSIALGTAVDEGKISAASRCFSWGYASSLGQINSTSSGFAIGRASKSGLISATREGAFAGGEVNGTDCAIIASEAAAFAFGYVDGPQGEIICEGEGATSTGWVKDNSLIKASGRGAYAGGFASSDSSVFAGIDGAFAHGYANEGGMIKATNLGATAFGYTDEGGMIHVNGEGSLAFGWADDSSVIRCARDGSLAFGCVDDEGLVEAEGYGSFAWGGAQSNTEFGLSGSIRAVTTGSQAFGRAGPGGQINAGKGSEPFGIEGNGAFANGAVEPFFIGEDPSGNPIYALGEISALAEGSRALGRVNGGKIRAEGLGSFAGGTIEASDSTIAAGDGSFAYGRSVRTRELQSMIIGRFGEAKAAVVDATDSISGTGSFQIAGGTSSAGGTGAISVMIGTKAFSDVAATGGGFAEFWSVSGADYAEYFEWKDGNVSDEDRIGYFVKPDLDKIVIAADSDNVVGVVGATGGYIGDSAELHWSGANMKDDYGRLVTKLSYKSQLLDILSKHHAIRTQEINQIMEGDDDSDLSTALKGATFMTMEDNSQKPLTGEKLTKLVSDIDSVKPIVVAVTNPNYDAGQKYVPRSERKEWAPVGMMGKVYVRDNGQCVPGSKCDCKDGIAVPGNTWYILSRSSSNVIRILMK